MGLDPSRHIRRVLNLSLRARLILLVIASVLPILSYSLALQYLQYRDEVANTGRRTLDLARSMTRLLEQEMQTRLAALRTLSLSPRLPTDDFEGFRELADKLLLQQFPGANIVVLRADGQQMMNTLQPPG